MAQCQESGSGDRLSWGGEPICHQQPMLPTTHPVSIGGRGVNTGALGINQACVAPEDSQLCVLFEPISIPNSSHQLIKNPTEVWMWSVFQDLCARSLVSSVGM